jgi:quercetin dioxygenase-like cupin family protein
MQEQGMLPRPVILNDLFSDEALRSRAWEPFRKGIEICWMYRSPAAAAAALLRYSPGATLERHVHAGFEHILVLRGSQTDENGEHGPGTLLIHAPGTSHAIHSREGCTVLAIWEKAIHTAPATAAFERGID